MNNPRPIDAALIDDAVKPGADVAVSAAPTASARLSSSDVLTITPPTTAIPAPPSAPPPAPSPDPKLRSSPGANLVAVREKYSLTVEQIAHQLNLSAKQIIALENDDYASLPAPAIARGFLRSYAKLMELDPVPLLAMLGPTPPLPGSVPSRSSKARTLVHNNAASGQEQPLSPNSRRLILIAAGLAVLVAAGVVSYSMGWLPGSPTRRGAVQDRKVANVNQAQTNASADASALADAAAFNVGRSNGDSEKTNLGGNQTSGVPAAVDSQTGSQTGSERTQAMAENGLPVVSIGVLEQSIDTSRIKPANPPGAASTSNALVLNFKQDSWVEIKRADNTPVVAKVMKRGAVETFDINEPLTLTIGNAAGVAASVRGTPVNLASAGNGNVARIKLR